MPIKDTLETFGYFIKEADKLEIAYIILVRYDASQAPVFDGKPPLPIILYNNNNNNNNWAIGVVRGTDHDMIQSYKPFFKHAKFILNLGLSPDEAEALIKDGKIDAAMFGSLWISNPDVARRIEKGIPLREDIDWVNVYGHGVGGDQRKGYTDYPFAEEN